MEPNHVQQIAAVEIAYRYTTREKRMRTILLIVLTAIIASAGGCAAGFGGALWPQDFFASKISATGVVMLESYDDPAWAGASGLPPSGYYIESSATGRVYIEHSAVEHYLGRQIRATGRLETLCGPDGVNCYPVVRSAKIETP